MSYELQSIGVIHSPFGQAPGTPLQNFAAAAHAGGLAPEGLELPEAVVVDPRGGRGTIELVPEWQDALRNLDGYDRIWLLFGLDRCAPAQAMVTPFRDTVPRGLFSTRAPARPNRIGLSAVRLLGVAGRFVHVAELDALDGSPLWDIKPYVRDYDCHPAAKRGWLDEATVDASVRVADDRFAR